MANDRDRTARMVALLAEKYAPPKYAPLWECGEGTGAFGGGYADLIAVPLWPSERFALRGFEIKASRADLKRELARPEKSEAFARYCHRWTLVTWDTAVVGTLSIPPEWAWWSVKPDGLSFTVHQRGAVRDAVKEWPKEFAAMMIRRAASASPNAELVAATLHAFTVRSHVEQDHRVTEARRRAHRAGWFAARGVDHNRVSQYSDEGRALLAEWKKDFDAFAAAGYYLSGGW